jgi:aspartyl/asparaginyl-tRNA synthetase
MAVIDPGARLKGSQKVHSWLFAQRKSKNVIFVFLTDQRLTLTVIDPGVRLKWSQKVHSWLFAPRKAKSVVFAFLANQ